MPDDKATGGNDDYDKTGDLVLVSSDNVTFKVDSLPVLAAR